MKPAYLFKTTARQIETLAGSSVPNRCLATAWSPRTIIASSTSKLHSLIPTNANLIARKNAALAGPVEIPLQNLSWIMTYSTGLASGLGAMWDGLAWHHQGQAPAPYLGQIIGLSLWKSLSNYIRLRILPYKFSPFPNSKVQTASPGQGSPMAFSSLPSWMDVGVFSMQALCLGNCVETLIGAYKDKRW